MIRVTKRISLFVRISFRLHILMQITRDKYVGVIFCYYSYLIRSHNVYETILGDTQGLVGRRRFLPFIIEFYQSKSAI